MKKYALKLAVPLIIIIVVLSSLSLGCSQPVQAPTTPAATTTSPATSAKPAPAQTTTTVPAPTVATTTAAPQPSRQTIRLTWGQVGSASSFAVPTIAQAKLINENIPWIQVTIKDCGGTQGMLTRLISREVDSSAGTYQATVQGYQGAGAFKGQAAATYFRTLPIWGGAYPEYYYVRADSNVKTLKDLEGKKFSPGGTGSSSTLDAQDLLAKLGIKPDFFLGSFTDIAEATKNNRIIGFGKAASGIEIDAVAMEVNAGTPLRIISLTDQELATALQAVPGKMKFDVPAGAIKSLPNQGRVLTWGCWLHLTVRTDMTSDAVYEITKVLNEKYSYIQSVWPLAVGKDPIRDTLKELMAAETAIPLHIGAVRYLKDIGIEVPQKLLPPEWTK